MTVLPITLTISGAAAIVNLWLAVRCASARVAGKTLVGDGGDPKLIAKMRAHANFIEYAPMVLILLALIEAADGSRPWLWGVGIAFIVGRLLHPFGLDRGDANWMRGIGILATFVVLIVLAGYALYLPYAYAVAPVTLAT